MDEKKWALEVSEKIKHKMRIVAERSQDKIPYKTENGVFEDFSNRIGWWTNGFWGGTMWQMYHATGDELYREMAERTEKKMDAALMDSRCMDHDSGFRWLPTSVANYRVTGNMESRNRAILVADNLAGRFNPVGQFIRAWNNYGKVEGFGKAGWAIIDCMMNLPLLYWAYKELNDPRYLQIATMHADTTEKYFLREDGSSKHIVEFDPATGEYVKSQGGQGYAHGSSWTRGQGWAIYGFVLSYIHTGNEKYLGAAKRVANYFIANMPESGLIPIDFRQPADCTLEDATAAAIAACGMIEIAKQLKSKGELAETESRVYLDAAMKILKALEEKRCNWDDNCDQLLEKCSVAFHSKETEVTLMYADYYFIEAIWKLTDQELFIW